MNIGRARERREPFDRIFNPSGWEDQVLTCAAPSCGAGGASARPEAGVVAASSQGHRRREVVHSFVSETKEQNPLNVIAFCSQTLAS